jgi:hypothetical protein
MKPTKLFELIRISAARAEHCGFFTTKHSAEITATRLLNKSIGYCTYKIELVFVDDINSVEIEE